MSDRSLPFSETISAQPVICEACLAPKTLENRDMGARLTYAFHMDALKFADYLSEIATSRGVQHYLDHVVDIAGVDHVGIGSDFDGVGDSLPTGLKDVSDFPNLVYELLKRGYSEADVRKILGENLLRVWSEVERVAAESAAGG